DVITLAELGAPGAAMDVLLEKSARLIGRKTGAARPLGDGSRVRIHLGSTNVPARVFFLESGPLCAGGSALAELRFEHPGFAFAGDRFIVRDWSEQATIAGGIVLDPDASSKRFRAEAQ